MNKQIAGAIFTLIVTVTVKLAEAKLPYSDLSGCTLPDRNYKRASHNTPIYH